MTAEVGDDQEKVAQEVARYDLHAIPVVDAERHMLGIITHDDVMDVVSAEASEDVYRMAASGQWRKITSRAACVRSGGTSSRLAWLFLVEMLTLTVLAGFEHSIQKIVALAFFVPLCIATGGNSGSRPPRRLPAQLRWGILRRSIGGALIKHELAIGIGLGLTLGAMGFAGAFLAPTDSLGGSNRWLFALVISQAVTAICLWGTLVGSMLPLVFRRMGIDPAYA